MRVCVCLCVVSDRAKNVCVYSVLRMWCVCVCRPFSATCIILAYSTEYVLRSTGQPATASSKNEPVRRNTRGKYTRCPQCVGKRPVLRAGSVADIHGKGRRKDGILEEGENPAGAIFFSLFLSLRRLFSRLSGHSSLKWSAG